VEYSADPGRALIRDAIRQMLVRELLDLMGPLPGAQRDTNVDTPAGGGDPPAKSPGWTRR